MIEIDGGFGSGGGQVVRTAVGLAAYTGQPCRIINIRAARPKPGLQEQHLQAVRAAATVCGGELNGAVKGSSLLEFIPGTMATENVRVTVATAGSIGLVLQALMIPAAKHGLSVEIRGGATYGKWAPPVSYLRKIILTLLGQAGYNGEIKIDREGFYPKGGSVVSAKFRPAQFSPFSLTDPGRLARVKGVSVAASVLRDRNVAERQAREAERTLRERLEAPVEIESRYCDTVCVGSGLQLWAETTHSVLGGSGLGERGKSAETVGREAADNLLSELNGGAVDSHAADQLLPYLAIASGELTTSRITDHCLTNAHVVEKFLPVKLLIVKNRIRAVSA